MNYKTYVQALSLMESLNEAAVILGDNASESITEEIRDTCIEALQALLQFCEDCDESLLWQIKDLLQSMAAMDIADPCAVLLQGKANEAMKLLQKQDFTAKVLFLSFMPSTWLALEPVYKAFAEDKRFEVQTVITPLLRAKTGGKDIIYSDYLSPKGVDVRHYSDYEFAFERPDIVFTNNPNDLDTLPKFLAKNIASYCDKLVYVPYFSMHGTTESTLAAYFGTYVHSLSWRIIVQSEELQRLYMKYSRFPEEKVLPLGTPKTDCILQAMKEPPALSGDWEKKIKGRKVILFNSHFGSLPYDWNMTYYNDIFETGARGDVAVIWRPHPVTMENIEVNAPELKPVYEDMLKRADDSPNIILDCTVDYLPAFIYSDAMVTTPSSLMCEYLVTGKPVLGQYDHKAYVNATLDRLIDDQKAFYQYDRMPCAEFVDNILAGRDMLKERRMRETERFFVLDGGRVGQSVKDRIVRDMSDLV